MIFGVKKMKNKKTWEPFDNLFESKEQIIQAMDQFVRIAHERMTKDVDYKKEVIAVLDAVGKAVEQVKAHLEEEE
jgi:glyceraldehyde-3-phosphate dehydrogenase/erythrose-4-phosphate dehydrogenase